MDIYIFLFNNFQTLDVFGPIEVFGSIGCINLHYCSLSGGTIYSCHQVPIMTKELPSTFPKEFVFFIPGGPGTRSLVHEKDVINQLEKIIQKASYCLTVCTGSAVLAKTGLLNHKFATSNKMAWSWVISTNDQVDWQSDARWCVDDRFYTSSGISAGIDMALRFVADRYDLEIANTIAQKMEYVWNDCSSNDPFAKD
ncbi:DJ-1/PfpI family protein [Commensalibacter oyaizuii]|uniref:DJ-1/PfpI family protein n=1 Tax=Commensalibacter oyaizuii TaxID=3043873 RepID=A0ABT6PYE4_9PROT|nr:DJ-1/PfpI family protein [Commensalibacter sp. TBRC 16381]MDI2089886.1 DJ-1/PfpI family protein [Commensalibacter sp. TBRC 16381]